MGDTNRGVKTLQQPSVSIEHQLMNAQRQPLARSGQIETKKAPLVVDVRHTLACSPQCALPRLFYPCESYRREFIRPPALDPNPLYESF